MTQQIHEIARLQITTIDSSPPETYVIDGLFTGICVGKEYDSLAEKYKYTYATLIHCDNCNDLLWQNPATGLIDQPPCCEIASLHILRRQTYSMWNVPSIIKVIPEKDKIYLNNDNINAQLHITNLIELIELLHNLHNHVLTVISYNQQIIHIKYNNDHLFVSTFIIAIYNTLLNIYVHRSNHISQNIIQRLMESIKNNLIEVLTIPLNTTIHLFDTWQSKQVIRLVHDFKKTTTNIYLRYPQEIVV